ncbi:MAG: NAD(P)H-hydrate dehydratase [Candidatus Omnitrophica bacterium]|nr:NAD(P)H-hydrate dehydratase [Candidatus Omnitrophota bacterium]
MKIPKTLADIVIPERKPDTHKGDVGAVFVVAGSLGMTGAACLCCEAALRSGCGLVKLGIPSSLNAICATKLTEVMTRPLREDAGGVLSPDAEEEICECIEESDVVVIGPGLSRHRPTQLLVRSLLTRISKPVVLDADGLNALEEATDILLKKSCSLTVTPHPGELTRLLKKDIESIKRDRLSCAVTFARTYETTVVLKGHNTIVASPCGASYCNQTGNSGMATAGSGDVLTGVIAGLLAQGFTLYDSARMGVYIHGLAGDLAEQELGSYGLIAGDILGKIPLAFKTVFS